MTDTNRSRKRKRAIDYDGVRYLVLQEPNDYRVAFEAFEALREKMLGNTDEVEEKPKKVSYIISAI